jgi:RNA polymerase sigma factor (sigma-70 family)
MDANTAKQIPSDGELLAEIQNGNDEAAAEFCQRHSSALLAVIVKFLAKKGCNEPLKHAQGLIGEVWGRAFSNLKTLKDVSKFDAWRDQIARNVVYGHLKGCITEQRTSVDLEDEQLLADGEIAASHKVVESAIFVEQILGLAESISPKFARILKLRELSGFSWDEIAAQLGENSGSLRKFYQRELIKLKKKAGGRGG